LEAFRQLQRVLGDATVQLIDTYDTLEGARRAAGLGRPLWGVRIDSGDFLALSRQVRAILDQAGLPDARIMASGDLDEYRIRDLVNAGAPIDSFGVGTQLATSADAPRSARFTKWWNWSSAASNVSPPSTAPARFRSRLEADFSARSARRGGALGRMRQRRGAAAPGDPGRAPGRAAATVEQARRRAAESLAKLPPALRQLEVAEPWPVLYSRELRALIDRTRSNVAG